MATLRVTVQIGGASPLDDTVANRRRMFVFAGSGPLGASTGNIAGNIGARLSRSQYAYDLNAIKIPGSISVSSFSPARFVSEDLAGQPGLVGQLSDALEAGYVEVVDENAPVPGQSGVAATLAAPSGDTITVTGLTGMTNPDSIGRYLEISGATDTTNNGRWLITAYNSATSVDIYAPGAGGSEASLAWEEQGVVADRTDLAAYL